MDDYNFCLEMMPDAEIEVVRDCLRLSKDALNISLNQLPGQLTGRLMAEDTTEMAAIQSLIFQASKPNFDCLLTTQGTSTEVYHCQLCFMFSTPCIPKLACLGNLDIILFSLFWSIFHRSFTSFWRTTFCKISWSWSPSTEFWHKQERYQTDLMWVLFPAVSFLVTTQWYDSLNLLSQFFLEFSSLVFIEASSDYTLRLWDLSNGREIEQYDLSQMEQIQPVNLPQTKFCNNEKWVFITQHPWIFFWDLETGQPGHFIDDIPYESGYTGTCTFPLYLKM